MITINISLETKEIIFDVQNKTYLTGRSREAEGTKGYEAASHIQASDDDENAYQIRRSINNIWSDLKAELAEYISQGENDTDNLIDELIDNGDKIMLSLSMPSNYNTAASANIAAGVHQYIVNKAIADWYMITNKADSDDYNKLADKALQATKRSLYKRSRPDRPRYDQQSQ